ncbi:MAG: L-threonylcarbamoyladenylate synthase [Salinispira sp.]
MEKSSFTPDAGGTAAGGTTAADAGAANAGTADSAADPSPGTAGGAAQTTLRLTADDLERAGQLLREGELVIFPTETVYGLGAMADDDAAVQKIFRVKGRPADNPLIVHVADRKMAADYAADMPDIACCLFESFSPGPLTLIVNRRPHRVPAAAAGHNTIALRIPSSSIARALIAETGAGIAAPSANRSGRPSPTTFDMAWHEMNGNVAAIIEGPSCELGLESTIVYCGTQGCPRILRPGSISSAMINRALKIAGLRQLEKTAPLTDPTGPIPADHVPAPGTRYRHYAPRTPLKLYQNVDELRNALSAAEGNGQVWLIVPDPAFTVNFHSSDYSQNRSEKKTAVQRSVHGGYPNNLRDMHDAAESAVGRSRRQIIRIKSTADYARNLYRIFYEIDRAAIDRSAIEGGAAIEAGAASVILAWLPPETADTVAADTEGAAEIAADIGEVAEATVADTAALRDRLQRAAHSNGLLPC